MKSKDEIERIKAILNKMRLTIPPISFLMVTVILMSVFSAGFGLSALIGLFIAGSEYIAFSLMLNRWAGL